MANSFMRKVVSFKPWRSTPKKIRGGWGTQVSYDCILECGHEQTKYQKSIKPEPTRVACRTCERDSFRKSS